MQVTLYLDGRTASGGAALVLHNERLADPLDPITRELGTVTGKRKKTLEDHEQIGYLEFLGGLYTDPVLELPLNGHNPAPILPAWNILRCLQDGAKRSKRGMDVPRGIHPLIPSVPIEFDGPKDPQEMWDDGRFSLRKSVGVQRARTMRTRPIFTDWEARLPIEVDLNVFDVDTLRAVWEDAGRYAGIGEMRPIFGHFAATIEES